MQQRNRICTHLMLKNDKNVNKPSAALASNYTTETSTKSGICFDLYTPSTSKQTIQQQQMSHLASSETSSQTGVDISDQPSKSLAKLERKSSEDLQKTTSSIKQHQRTSAKLNSMVSQQSLTKAQSKEKFIKALKFRLFKTRLSYMNQQILLANNYSKNKKVFRTLLFVTCYLITFWLPWVITWPIDAYCECVPVQVTIVTYWMEYSNSFINSIILIVGNHHFRKKLFSLFKKN